MRFNKIRQLGSNGISLLETLIGMTIMGVVTMAVFQAYITQHQSYSAQYDVSVIQQNARASIDMLANNLRMAGYNLPGGLPAIVASNTDPDTVTVTFQEAGCETYLSSSMPQPSAELTCGSDVSCFSEGDWIYIFEPDSGIGEWLEITQVQVAAGNIQHNTMPLTRKYGANSLVLAMNQLKFYIDNTDDPDHPMLMVKRYGQPAVVYAEDIIDLQFQYRMKNGQIVDVPVLVTNIREIIISLTGRSENQDVVLAERESDDNNDQQGQSGSHGGYRTRSYHSSVYLRNIGL